PVLGQDNVHHRAIWDGWFRVEDDGVALLFAFHNDLQMETEPLTVTNIRILYPGLKAEARSVRCGRAAFGAAAGGVAGEVIAAGLATAYGIQERVQCGFDHFFPL